MLSVSPLMACACFAVVASLPGQALGGPVTLPGGETCSEAVLVSEGVYLGDTTFAAPDGNAICAESAASPDLFYSVIPAEDSMLRLSLCGSAFDTMLSVHSGCPGDETTEVACSDDFDCDGDGGVQDDGYVSELRIRVDAGIEYFVRVSGWTGDRGQYVLDVSFAPIPKFAEGADILIGEIGEFIQVGRVGGIVGCVMDSPVCNAGSEPLDWYPLEDGRHPFMVFNMYRLMDDRITQIGQSQVKHGIASAQANACGLGCVPHPDSTRTGVGCSDTYSAGFNANQQFFGPRSEIDPWAPSFEYTGSHLDTSPGGHNGVTHRLQIADTDLDSLTNPGAEYFCELYVLSHDDVDHLNSVAHEPVGVSGIPGGTWSFSVGGGQTSLGSAINAWPGASVSVLPEQPVDDGRVYLGAKATDLGDGTWRYEYAMFNLDMSRAVGAFSLPVGADAALTGVGFHAVLSHGEPFTNDSWGWSHEGGVLTWATTPFEIDPQANPLRWGTTYNFWFETDAPPADVTASVHPYFPVVGGGGALVVTGSTIGPAGCVADLAEPFGVLDFSDVSAFLSAFSQELGEADLVEPFNVWNFSDVVAFLNSFGSGCP